MNSFLAILATAQTAQEGPNSMLPTLMMVASFGLIFYFLIIRPQNLRRKQQETLIAAVKAGDKVILNSGLHGIVANVKETTLLVKVADNVKLEFEKSAVAAVTKSEA